MAKATERGLDLTVKSVILLWAITFAHHIYGGVSFDSPERTTMAVVFTVILVATVWLYRLAAIRHWAARIYPILVVAFWVVLLGFYEGGYNHTLYVILLLAGDTEVTQRLYPAGSDAVISNDVFFQGTGIATLLFAIVVGLTMLRRPRRASEGDDGDHRGLPPSMGQQASVRPGPQPHPSDR